MMARRVGVASIVQETNTFSPLPATLDDFQSQGIFHGQDVTRIFDGTNTEVGGALAEVDRQGLAAVPLMRAWAMSSGPIRRADMDHLVGMLSVDLAEAGPLDGLVLSLHGALVTEDGESGDSLLLRASRQVLGRPAVIGVCLDLHANLTKALVEEANCLVGYLTYPHVDQGDTGGRIARLVSQQLLGTSRPVTCFAKRPLLIPAEAQGFEGPLGEMRRAADQRVAEGCLDVSLFPVQPWLDVPELGFGVAVTTDGDRERATSVAEEIAEAAWRRRHDFRVPLEVPEAAISRARSAVRRPVVLSESADSPTSGTPADSPAMVRELLHFGTDLRACVSLVDPPSVERCIEIGAGGQFSGQVGCTFEHRFHSPVRLIGIVERTGEGAFSLTGPAFTGMSVSMGRYAVVSVGKLQVLLTERPAPTFDPAAYRFAGIDVGLLDVVVVRSANLFRAAYAQLAGECIILDLPGASTPRLESLEFSRAPRPLFPLDR
jgi:microcystin degradation protein MlrC